MKNTLLKIALLPVAFFMLTNCGNDDAVDPVASIDAIQANSIEILTGGDAKTWKISSAQLDANGTILDLSSNFNITDDEFIFSGTVENGMLNWRPGHAVNLEGTTNQETLLDYYLGPISSSVTFYTDSGTSLTTLDGAFTFDVVDANTITGVLTTSGRQASGDLSITLTQKMQADYASIPANGLDFSLVTSFTTENSNILGAEIATGFIGSYSENSFYIITRDDSQITIPGDPGPEQILKFNIDTNTFEENLFYQDQYVTKRLNIINNELVVFGGQFANTYPLNPNGDPTSIFQHDLALTRFGFSVQNDLAYITGGDTAQNDLANKIRSYNYITNEIQEIAILPVTRFRSDNEVVNDKLYIFGGRNGFNIGNPIPEKESYILNILTGEITSFDMPDDPYSSNASRNEHLIYVGYETRTDNGSDDDDSFDKTINFGVYNTLDDSFTVLAHNLDDSAEFTTIEAMTVFNGNLYVIYGDTSNPATVSIFSAPI
ncbi:MAG: hypothetical protein ACSHW7_09805 [Patiriisocius sp.]|uniref:hypothetical protein n=1 Tax=Patiriisocius sp. TaxID=2822396 RepID=UPI003EF77064